MNKLRFFYFDLLRRFRDNEPSLQELNWAWNKLFRRKNGITNVLIMTSLSYRCEGFTLEEIADRQGVTRERIRQHILKACRMAREL